jgi:predicted transcriptional regulator
MKVFGRTETYFSRFESIVEKTAGQLRKTPLDLSIAKAQVLQRRVFEVKVN